MELRLSLLPARVPAIALYDLTALFVPVGTPSGSTVELRITISDVDLSLRDFGAYLSLTDRVYGRVTEAGLRSYAKTPYRHLRVTEIRKGSIEIILAQMISHSKEATSLAILWLFLKYLPSAIKSSSEVVKNFADSYKSIEEAKLIRQNRKHLREEIKKDEALAKLDPKRLNQLVVLLEDLQAKESQQLTAPVRFAQEDVKSIELVVVDKQD
jgi:hypothetical protein